MTVTFAVRPFDHLWRAPPAPVRFYDRALAAAETQALYQMGQ